MQDDLFGVGNYVRDGHGGLVHLVTHADYRGFDTACDGVWDNFQPRYTKEHQGEFPSVASDVQAANDVGLTCFECLVHAIHGPTDSSDLVYPIHGGS